MPDDRSTQVLFGHLDSFPVRTKVIYEKKLTFKTGDIRGKFESLFRLHFAVKLNQFSKLRTPSAKVLNQQETLTQEGIFSVSHCQMSLMLREPMNTL